MCPRSYRAHRGRLASMILMKGTLAWSVTLLVIATFLTTHPSTAFVGNVCTPTSGRWSRRGSCQVPRVNQVCNKSGQPRDDSLMTIRIIFSLYFLISPLV